VHLLDQLVVVERAQIDFFVVVGQPGSPVGVRGCGATGPYWTDETILPTGPGRC